MPLKLVLLSPQGAVAANGKARVDVVKDLCTFIRRMAAKGVQVAIWSRHRMTLDGEALDACLQKGSGVPVRHFVAATEGYPARQYGGSANPILAELGVERHETILVGSSATDLQAGVNNRLLLVRPAWYGDEIDYGFRVSSIGRLAQFCEVFALRQHPIYWSIDESGLQVRSMGPFSTLKPDFAQFGADARRVAKDNVGDAKFWFLMIVSSLYFSGIVHTVNYICPFPGHDPASTGSTRHLMDSVMSLFGKCFRKPYLPDLVVRHTKSKKSQNLKPEEKTFANHLNTIHLNPHPRSYDNPEPRKSRLPLKGKTVLVVDDFLTNGRSLDSARAYIHAAGAHAIMFSWLKTINTPFLHMASNPPLKPFEPNIVAEEPNHVEYRYYEQVVAHRAPAEIQRIFEAYRNWRWP